jgi:CheY-like chemotaxis protein
MGETAHQTPDARPRSDAPPETAAEPGAAEPAGDVPTGRDPERPRVVLVDDHAPLRAIVGELLTDHGMQVVGTAGDGGEVLDAIATACTCHGGVDVVVMDERLPRMSGLEATRRVADAVPGLPVVLYTAFAGLLGDAPRRAGVVAEVSKGSHPTLLVDAILGACRGAGHPTASRTASVTA